MNIVALILLIIAAVLFIVDVIAPGRYRATALGFAVLTAGLIFQYASTSHSITF